MVDGQQAAGIDTWRFETNSDAFVEPDSLRETRVRFTPEWSWLISAEPPDHHLPTGNQAAGRIGLDEARRRHPFSTRIVKVNELDCGAFVGTVAKTIGQFPKKRSRRHPDPITVETHSDRYELSPPWASGSGCIDQAGTIQRTRRWGYQGSWLAGIWSVTTTKPLPLAVVLLHWHLLLGDSSSRGGNELG